MWRAAKDMGLRAMRIEIEEEYCRRARSRLLRSFCFRSPIVVRSKEPHDRDIWEAPGAEAWVFDRLYDLLRHQWHSYPRLDEGANEEIIRCWHELMLIDGAMSFEVGGDEDVLVKQVSRALEREWGRPLDRTMRF
jgi:hypothetical protein